MTSTLNDIDTILKDGDIELLKQWIKEELLKRDIEYYNNSKLLHDKILNLEEKCCLLESALNNKPDKNDLDCMIFDRITWYNKCNTQYEN